VKVLNLRRLTVLQWFDIHLVRHTQFSGGYRADSRAVCNLWAVMKAWSSEQRRAVLRVRSTARTCVRSR
jgi:hypothetical protein